MFTVLSFHHRRRALTMTAAALFVTAWCVPVIDAPRLWSTRNAPGRFLYGWDALLTALSPILFPSAPTSADEVLAQVAAVSSALTNVLFVAVAVSLYRWQRWRPRLRVELALAVAVGIDLLWLASVLSIGGGMMPGYYLWLVSFIVLALAVRDRRRVAAPSEA